MIKVTFKYVNSSFKYLEIVGHSSDNLVCAGVSSIFVGGMNCLNNKDYEISIVEGNSYCKAINKISQKDEIILETIYIQLKTISETYKKEVKIIKEN